MQGFVETPITKVPTFLPGTFWACQDPENQEKWWRHTAQTDEIMFPHSKPRLTPAIMWELQGLLKKQPGTVDGSHAFMWSYDVNGKPWVHFAEHVGFRHLHALEVVQFLLSYPPASQHHALIQLDCYARYVDFLEAISMSHEQFVN